MKKVFFTPQYPAEPTKGMGYIQIDEEMVNRMGISPVYKPSAYGGRVSVYAPNGTKFIAYCDNPYGFGGRNKRRFTVHSHGAVIELVTQKKLTIDAVLHFVRTWAEENAKVITPGKRTINLSKETAKTPGYVYFIFNSDSNAIKIGSTKNIQRRLSALQTSSPAQLELLDSIKVESIQAAQKQERLLHEKFGELRITGEWFRSDNELLSYLNHHTD